MAIAHALGVPLIIVVRPRTHARGIVLSILQH
jgi:hypothetical protein